MTRMHKDFDLDNVQWLNAPKTFFPVPKHKEEPVGETRVCRGPRCVKEKRSYPIKEMWVARLTGRNIVFYCTTCKEKYTGNFDLVKFEDFKK